MRYRLSYFANEYPGLFMWTVVLPMICALYLLLAWALGWPPATDV